LALKSGLLGESEPLRRFGVFLDEAKVNAKAAAMGIAALGSKLTDGQKVAARYALIMEQTADGQGMFGRDADSAADAGKRLESNMTDLGAAMATGVVPVLAAVTGGLADLAGQLTGTSQAVQDVNWGPDPWGIMDALTLNIFNLDKKTQIMVDMTSDAAAEAAKSWDTYSERASGPIAEVPKMIETTGPKAYTAVLKTMAQVEKGIHDGAAGIASAMRDALSDRNREADAADQIIVNRAEIAAQKRIIADKKTTAAQKAEARIRLRALRADNDALEAEMELLKNKGYTYGRGFTLGFVRGLVKDTDRVGESARVLARTVKKYLQVHSPSEEGPFSEMGGPDGWGSRFGTLWAGGLARTAGAAAGAAGGFAGAVAMPGGGGIGVAGPPMGMGGGGGGVTLVVNSTYPPSPQQVREIADTLDAEFARRRGRYTAYGR
jgi:cell division protein FtsB